MADLYLDRFAKPKPTTVRNKKTVAIYRMIGGVGRVEEYVRRNPRSNRAVKSQPQVSECNMTNGKV